MKESPLQDRRQPRPSGVHYFTGQIFNLDHKNCIACIETSNLCGTSTQKNNKLTYYDETQTVGAKKKPKFSHGGPIQRQA